jgi:hypothetical protein
MPYSYPLARRDNPKPNLKSPPSTTSSRYLTPIQTHRIDTWRKQASSHSSTPTSTTTHTTPHTRTDVSGSPSKIKSAPASLAIPGEQTPSSNCHIHLSPGQTNTCSCTTTTSIRVKRQKGYYKRSPNNLKASKQATLTGQGPGVQPLSPTTPGIVTPNTANRPGHLLGNGLPYEDQNAAHLANAAPGTQCGTPPVVPCLEPGPARPLEVKLEPRIAGIRDPISHN